MFVQNKVTKICHKVILCTCWVCQSLPCREWQTISEPQSILVNSSNGDYVECFCLCRMCKTRSLLFLGRTCEFQSAGVATSWKMALAVLLLLGLFWSLVYCQTFPYVSFMSQTLANHSYVDLSLVGRPDVLDGGEGVQCITDLTTCCRIINTSVLLGVLLRVIYTLSI